jgi:hypothetical protein
MEGKLITRPMTSAEYIKIVRAGFKAGMTLKEAKEQADFYRQFPIAVLKHTP